jgi:hypothetical protein
MAKKMTDYRLNEMFDLYVKVSKNVNVYRGSEIGKEKKTVAWTVKSGQVAGKLYSWVTEKETGRIYMMFLINDDILKAYYIELEPRMINFEHFEMQLTAQKKAALSWYERIWYDFEESVTAYYNEVVDAAKSGLQTGLVIGAVVLIGVPLLKYYLVQRSVERLVKTAAKELKN